MRRSLSLLAPPIVTLVCWFGGRCLARAQYQPHNKISFSALLLVAYIRFAIAFTGAVTSPARSTEMILLLNFCDVCQRLITAASIPELER